MLESIKHHKLFFMAGLIGIAIITAIFLVTDYRDLGYISFNGSFIAPVGLFVWLVISIREYDKREK